MKLRMLPTGSAIKLTAVAIARSLSPNQVEAILLAKFKMKGYPEAAMKEPMKNGMGFLSVKITNSLTQDPMSIMRDPITTLTFKPNLFRTAIDAKLNGMYMI
jgi:hypothetical protein